MYVVNPVQRRGRPGLRSLLALLLLALPAAVAYGQPSCAEIESTLAEAPRFQALGILVARKCLGEENDRAAITVNVDAALDQNAKVLDERRATVLTLLDSLGDHARLLDGTDPDSPLAAIIPKLEEAEAHLDSDRVVTAPKSWELQLGGTPPLLNEVTAFRVADYLSGHCDGAPVPASCAPAYEATKNATRIAVLTARTLTLWRSKEVKEALVRLTILDNKWDAYFNDARSQYLWELWINGRIVKKRYPRVKLPLDLTRAGLGGYREVPRWQLIVAHPEVALEHVGAAADGSQQKMVAVLELLGANRWGYNADGTMGKALGAAVIFTASDRAGAAEEAWGLLVHVNHRYSFGATRHDGDTGYIVSADLAKLWTKVSEKRRKIMSGLDEP